MTAHRGGCRGDWGRRRKAFAKTALGRLSVDEATSPLVDVWNGVCFGREPATAGSRTHLSRLLTNECGIGAAPF
jgi:hypothetical protein